MGAWSRTPVAAVAAAAGAVALVLEGWLLLGGPLRAVAVVATSAAVVSAAIVVGIARRLLPRARPAWNLAVGRVARIIAALGAVYVLTVLVLVGRPSAAERPAATAGLVATITVLAALAVISTGSGWAFGRVADGDADPVDAVTARMARAVPLDEALQQIVDVLRRGPARRSVEIWQRRGERLVLTHAGPLRDAGPKRLDRSSADAAVRAGIVGSAWLRTWLPSLLDIEDDAVSCATGAVAGAAGIGDEADAEHTRVAPLAAHGELLGFVVLRRAASDPHFDRADDETLTSVQHPVASALEHARLDAELQARIDELRARNTELQRSRARLVFVADAERRRLERDLHDGAQSHLTTLEVKLQLAKVLATRRPERASELIGALEQDVVAAAEELRSLAHGILPSLLLTGGLRDGLLGAASRAPVPVTVDDIATTRFPPEVEAAVYFCCLEAIQNVAKHAGPGATARVTVSSDERWLRFVVSDDGAGIGPASGNELGDGHGMVNMADRIGALGGTVTLGPRPGGGTAVTGQVPLGPGTASSGTAAGPASAR